MFQAYQLVAKDVNTVLYFSLLSFFNFYNDNFELKNFFKSNTNLKCDFFFFVYFLYLFIFLLKK